jgi:phosphotransferase system HPr (HPr) family protein
MPTIDLTLTNKVGLHARPAGALVRVAKEQKADVKITYKDKTANAKSILSVLSLGAEAGAVIRVEANGEGAEQALEAIQKLVGEKFGEAE